MADEMSWKCMCLKSTWWLKIYLSTRRAKQKTHTIDVETFLFESEILFEHRSNYKAIEIGAIKFHLQFSFFLHCPSNIYTYSIQFNEEHNHFGNTVKYYFYCFGTGVWKINTYNAMSTVKCILSTPLTDEIVDRVKNGGCASVKRIQSMN